MRRSRYASENVLSGKHDYRFLDIWIQELDSVRSMMIMIVDIRCIQLFVREARVRQNQGR